MAGRVGRALRERVQETEGQYWYYLAKLPLVLDHLHLSDTLKLRFLNSREPGQPFPRAEEEQ